MHNFMKTGLHAFKRLFLKQAACCLQGYGGELDMDAEFDKMEQNRKAPQHAGKQGAYMGTAWDRIGPHGTACD